MDTTQTKDKIQQLIEKYNTEKSADKISKYTEAETKTGFIEPLFQSLGWDTQNRDEVGLETTLSSGRADYSFKISGIVKFFVEAKPFRVDLDNPQYIQQTINYAWHKGVVWAILTDFESIKVFNAEWKTKNITENLFFELKYSDYLTNFDQLHLLSKESVNNGLLDKQAEKWGKKIKKAPVSKQILDDLLSARTKLTKNILQHPRLNNVTESELDESVQRILDRLIFIRTCEDRNIEHKHLLSALRDKDKHSLSKEIQKIFHNFDSAYNSKLFENHLCDTLTIDDEVLAEIVDSLYHTADGNIHYDFSVINADVLGNIYEQYLGHILKKTSKSAKLKETHQHRKQQGIYYTPTYIVDYIVKNTLGEILKTAKPKEVTNLKILDPACGSGSFLIRAFDELVTYWSKKLPGEFEYFRKMEILKNNIYGVDLDKQAVEITQMNLLLKTVTHKERLPYLKNIKCGNSLVNDPTIAGDKAFNWEEEFKEVLCHCDPERSRRGGNLGFDVIIGNPPYVNMQLLDAKEIGFYKNSYSVANKYFDLFALFIERSLKNLKENGLFSFIVPSLFLKGMQYDVLRKLINSNSVGFEVEEFGDGVFENVKMPTCVFVLKKGENRKNKNYFMVKGLNVFGKTKMISLGEITAITRGLEIGRDKLKDKDDIPCITGSNIERYSIKTIRYISKSVLAQFKKSDDIFSGSKIVIRETGNQIVSTYDSNGFITTRSLYNLRLVDKEYSLLYILALLNSSLYKYYFKCFISPDTNIFPKIRVEQARQIPIHIINFSNIEDKKMHDNLVNLSDQMLDLNKQLQKFGDKLTDERRKLESEIQKTNNQIDQLVYQLYGLTEEEIKIVEE